MHILKPNQDVPGPKTAKINKATFMEYSFTQKYGKKYTEVF